MSDLYLELVSRIPIVAEKTHLGTARIQEAQSAVGLSNEGVARKIPISEKTWRRWKTDGEIPTAHLPTVAKVLRLELHDADDEMGLRVSEIEREQEGLRAQVEETRDLARQILELLRGDPPPAEDLPSDLP